MIVITGGQSFDEIAKTLTLDAAYGPAIAAHNNMEGQDIGGKKFRLEIPDNWALTEYAGKTIKMPDANPINWMMWGGVAIIAVLLMK